jgi:gliding motility-associated lipoprotein GldH
MKYYFKSLFLCIYLIIIVLISSCNNDNILFENYKTLEQGFWQYDSTIIFKFRVTERSQNYTISTYLRNTISYPYYNLYVQYQLKSPKGDTLSTAMKELILMNAKTGQPFGKVAEPTGKGVGYYYDHEFILLNNYQFPDTGLYELQIKQFMRLDTLPHIHAIGAKIEKH